MDQTFSFPGMSPHVDNAATAQGFEDKDVNDERHLLVGKAKNIAIVNEIQHALGQVDSAPAENKQAIFDHAVKLRWALLVGLQAADEAIKSVADAYDLDFAPLQFKAARSKRSMKTQAETEAKLKAEVEARAKAQAEADAKAKADAEAKAKLEADAKAKAAEQAKAQSTPQPAPANPAQPTQAAK